MSDSTASTARDVSGIARGTFTVSITPSHSDGTPEIGALGRSSLTKTWSGDITGTSTGEMLSALTAVKGSAVYVAIERVTGSIHGHHGTFVLYHRGVMDRGAQQLIIAVAPDSGSGELTGLSGELRLIIEKGVHAYEMPYRIVSDVT